MAARDHVDYLAQRRPTPIGQSVVEDIQIP